MVDVMVDEKLTRQKLDYLGRQRLDRFQNRQDKHHQLEEERARREKDVSKMTESGIERLLRSEGLSESLPESEMVVDGGLLRGGEVRSPEDVLIEKREKRDWEMSRDRRRLNKRKSVEEDLTLKMSDEELLGESTVEKINKSEDQLKEIIDKNVSERLRQIREGRESKLEEIRELNEREKQLLALLRNEKTKLSYVYNSEGDYLLFEGIDSSGNPLTTRLSMEGLNRILEEVDDPEVKTLFEDFKPKNDKDAREFIRRLGILRDKEIMNIGAQKLGIDARKIINPPKDEKGGMESSAVNLQYNEYAVQRSKGIPEEQRNEVKRLVSGWETNGIVRIVITHEGPTLKKIAFQLQEGGFINLNPGTFIRAFDGVDSYRIRDGKSGLKLGERKINFSNVKEVTEILSGLKINSQSLPNGVKVTVNQTQTL